MISLIRYKTGKKYFLIILFDLLNLAPPVIGPNNVFGGNNKKIKKFHNGK